MYSINNERNEYNKYKNITCVNCGGKGHVVRDCKSPITSFGIVSFKIVNSMEDEYGDTNDEIKDILKKTNSNSIDMYPKIKYLMIQRKDTIGFTDFIRGHYTNDEETIIKVCINEMTNYEKYKLLTCTFDELWEYAWFYRQSKSKEYEKAKEKYLLLNVPNLIFKSTDHYNFTEFSFPKGRRNIKETNNSCAEREYFEETGYNKSNYEYVKYYPIINEEFTGTNGIEYRHLYYLAKMKNNIEAPVLNTENALQMGEIRNIGWFDYNECISLIRPYDTEKINILTKINNDLLKMKNDIYTSPFFFNNQRWKYSRYNSTLKIA